MSTHCDAGDIARVTFPTGTIEDFTDTPVNITCTDEYPNCSRFLVTFRYQFAFANGNPAGSPASTTQLLWSTNNASNFTTRVILDGSTRRGQVYCKGANTSCGTEGWYTVVSSASNFYLFEITSIVPYQSNPDKQKRIKVIGYSGTELHSALYSNCSYSVECLEPCPEGTLDCGDCCLSCDETFNQISAMRAILAGIS